MVFSSNPLALSVPEDVLESWLRDEGYLEILDQRSSELNRHDKATPACTCSSGSRVVVHEKSSVPLFSYVHAILSLLTVNPFAKLTVDDFTGDIPSWTLLFIGTYHSYSFPSSPSQVRLRVHENVKRYAGNYAIVYVLFFACSLYQHPISLMGSLLCIALWDALRLIADHCDLCRYPTAWQMLVRSMQCVTAVILFLASVHVAVIWALLIGLSAMLMHATFRKLAPRSI